MPSCDLYNRNFPWKIFSQDDKTELTKKKNFHLLLLQKIASTGVFHFCIQEKINYGNYFISFMVANKIYIDYLLYIIFFSCLCYPLFVYNSWSIFFFVFSLLQHSIYTFRHLKLYRRLPFDRSFILFSTQLNSK